MAKKPTLFVVDGRREAQHCVELTLVVCGSKTVLGRHVVAESAEGAVRSGSRYTDDRNAPSRRDGCKGTKRVRRGQRLVVVICNGLGRPAEASQYLLVLGGEPVERPSCESRSLVRCLQVGDQETSDVLDAVVDPGEARIEKPPQGPENGKREPAQHPALRLRRRRFSQHFCPRRLRQGHRYSLAHDRCRQVSRPTIADRSLPARGP